MVAALSIWFYLLFIPILIGLAVTSVELVKVLIQIGRDGLNLVSGVELSWLVSTWVVLAVGLAAWVLGFYRS